MDSAAVLTLTRDDADVAVRFRQLHRPDGDLITRFEVVLEGADLTAAAWVTTINGDEGDRTSGEGVSVSLGHMLRRLGESTTSWTGTRGWRALEGLSVALTCDRTGHVTVALTLTDRAVAPRWSVTTSLATTLGELIDLGAAIEAWVAAGPDR